MLNAALFIARNDLLYMLKQKETLLWVFVMPFVFFYFIGTVTGGGSGMGGDTSKPAPVAVVAPADGGFLVEELFAAIEARNYEVVRVEKSEDLETYDRRLVLPEPAEGFASLTESMRAGNQAEIRLVREGAGTATDLDKLRIGRAIYGVLADVVVLGANGEELSEENLDALQAKPRALSLDVQAAGKRKVIPSGYSQTIPGTMVMFTLLILLTSGSILLVIERERGLLRRLASAPISRASVILGKWMGKMALALVQIGFAMIAGTLLFDMDWGEDLLAVCLVFVAWAAFCTSAALFMANLARTEGQMAGMGVVGSMVLAALGGCWWPIEVTADWMQELATWLPTGWTMEALHQLINFGNGPTAALNSVLLLVLSSLILCTLAARNFRYD